MSSAQLSHLRERVRGNMSAAGAGDVMQWMFEAERKFQSLRLRGGAGDGDLPAPPQESGGDRD